MTTWVEESSGGRARGPRGLARAWLEVLVRPRRFFRTGVAPGDQAPGLVFAVVVATVYAVGLLVADPALRPTALGGPLPSGLVAVAAVALLVAPAVLHLTAAVLTLLLIVASLRVRATIRSLAAGTGVRTLDRAGVSETVQIVAYASAPGVFAAVPLDSVRVAATVYAGALLVVGLRIVHGLGWMRVLVAAVGPAVALFGVGFGGVPAGEAILAELR